MICMFRFRIRHLLALLLLVAVGLWLVTQAGMSKAEIKVLDVSGLSFFGPDGSHDNWGVRFGKIRFRFLRPTELDDQFVNVFVNTARVFEEDDLIDRRVLFRYRSRKVLWMKVQNPTQLAIRELGLEEQDIEELITEVMPNVE